MNETAPIGVFDSGVGGLTVLRELLARLPGESFVYFGDTARVPYGTKSADTVLRFSCENIQLLLGHGVKIVVVACNTASAEAVPLLGKEFDVPIVGVIDPGVRAAAAATKTGRIGIIGTAGTIRSGAYQKGVRAVLPGATVIPQACPMFVPLAEEGWVDGDIATAVARRYLAVYDESGIDTLVLGCTHYPLLRGPIARAVRPGVQLVDSAVQTAIEVSARLEELNLRETGTGGFRVLLSDSNPAFEDVATRFLGRPPGPVELIAG